MEDENTNKQTTNGFTFAIGSTTIYCLIMCIIIVSLIGAILRFMIFQKVATNPSLYASYSYPYSPYPYSSYPPTIKFKI